MRPVIAGLAAIALVMGGCSDDDETTDALSAVCDQEEKVLEDLAALAALDPAASTTGDYQSAVDDLSSSIEDLQAARGDLAEQDVDNVQAAYDSLQSALEGLEDVPLAEVPEAAASEAQAQIVALQEQYATAYANSSCTPRRGVAAPHPWNGAPRARVPNPGSDFAVRSGDVPSREASGKGPRGRSAP